MFDFLEFIGISLLGILMLIIFLPIGFILFILLIPFLIVFNIINFIGEFRK